MGKIVSFLNNKYLVAIIVALFLFALFRKLR